MKELPSGVWSGEPDFLEFRVFGFECHAKRHDSMGHLCGYIQVDATHPWYGKDYNNVDVEVHGGLTYCTSGWFGFDCAHAGDLVPAMPPMGDNDNLFNDGDVYRDMGYVVNELIKLAKQAKEASDGQESN
jgi:hypothetical protein